MISPPATIDFETRSAFDLRKYGAWGYAEHESTEVMCMAVRMPNGREFLWHPEYPSLGLEEQGWEELAEFFRYVERGGLIEAHNVGFERAIWTMHCTPKLGWPVVRSSQWRCSSALAATFALPRNLADGADALGLDQVKDAKGARIMKRISKPRGCLKADMEVIAKHTLGDPGRWKEIPKPKNVWVLKQQYAGVPGVDELNPWHEDANDLAMLFDYCQQDVRTEHALSQRLGEMDPDELRLWQLDQNMNARGVCIDLDLVQAAIRLIDVCLEEANARMAELTEGAVQTCNQRDAFLEWINSRGGPQLEDAQKGTLEKAVRDPEWDDVAREALRVRLDAAKSSVKKYPSMLNVVNADGHARGLLAYHGADTGRWAGRMIQPQNFPRGTAPGDIDILCDTIINGDRETIEFLYGPTMEALASALRGAIVASPGTELICSDYSSIEARGTFWVAGDKEALKVFERGEDIYKVMATLIYNVPYDEVTKEQRQIGKKAILGLGYQMGWEKFRDTCADEGIILEDDMAKRVVRTYRTAHYVVRSFWYDIEKFAIAAVQENREIPFGRLRMRPPVDGFFRIQLPSGRHLCYFDPRVDWVLSKWQEEGMEETYKRALKEDWSVERCDAEGLKTKHQLTYMGVNSQTKKFCRQSTYGGRLTENVVQGLSRDVMASAMLRLADSGKYTPILTVHDEIIAEVDPGVGSVEEFEHIMTTPPHWADGFPIEASEGWRGHRYRK
jgi:DNA polymerase